MSVVYVFLNCGIPHVRAGNERSLHPRVPEAPRIGGLSARKCITPYKRQHIGMVALPPNRKRLRV